MKGGREVFSDYKMKEIIKGEIYDTNTAKLLVQVHYPNPSLYHKIIGFLLTFRLDGWKKEESIYITQKGRYFMFKEDWGGEIKFIPKNIEDVKQYLEKYPDIYEDIWGFTEA